MREGDVIADRITDALAARDDVGPELVAGIGDWLPLIRDEDPRTVHVASVILDALRITGDADTDAVGLGMLSGFLRTAERERLP